MTRAWRGWLATTPLVAAFCAAPTLAGAATFDIMVDTTPLSGTSGFVAFDVVDGDGISNNTVTVSDFVVSDGLLTDPASAVGDVIGGLSPGLAVIGDGTFLAELRQPITFGTSIGFRAEITTNGPFAPFPDEFSFFLLGSDKLPFATDDPLGAGALFLGDVDGPNPDLLIFSSVFATVTLSSRSTTTTTTRPATTTTTQPPVTTTSTPTTSTSNTSTTRPATTTLTTGCANAASFASARCRFPVLIDIVQTEMAPGPLRNRLVALLNKGSVQTEAAAPLVSQGRGHPAKAALRKAVSALTRFEKRLHSRRARSVPAGVRMHLLTSADALRADLRILRGGI